MDYVVPALLFALMGLVFAFLLALASRVFAVKQDPRIGELTDCLPGANCGGCGYAGCAAYAEAVVKGEAKIGEILREHMRHTTEDFFVSLEPHLQTFSGLNALVGRDFENPYQYADAESAFADAVIKFKELIL